MNAMGIELDGGVKRIELDKHARRKVHWIFAFRPDRKNVTCAFLELR